MRQAFREAKQSLGNIATPLMHEFVEKFAWPDSPRLGLSKGRGRQRQPAGISLSPWTENSLTHEADRYLNLTTDTPLVALNPAPDLDVRPSWVGSDMGE